MHRIRFVKVIMVALACTACLFTAAQQSAAMAKSPVFPSKALYDTIARLDSILFTAFNNRDLDKHKLFFATDIEFYHDKGGLSDYNQVIENTRRLFAQNNGLKRTLLSESLEVYPIRDYGAIQTGMHRFCHPENGRDDCGVFRFVHIWRRDTDGWKLARVISYDH